MAIFEFNAYDERKVQNQYATYDDINNRQAKQLREVLHRWENRLHTPWDVMRELGEVVGVYSEFLSKYNSSLRHGPGTPDFQEKVRAQPEWIRERYADLGKYAQRAEQDAIESVERVKNLENANWPVIRENLNKNYAAQIAQEPRFATPLKINDDIQGSRAYVDSLQNLIRLRDAESDELYKLYYEDAMVGIRLEKKQAEYDLHNIDEATQRYRQEKEREHEEMLLRMKRNFRPEVLDAERHASIIVENIRNVRFSLDVEDFDSWAAAQAMAEILLQPGREGEPSALNSFKQSLHSEKSYAEERRIDLDKTIQAFKSLTEDEVKAPLARKFAAERAEVAWKTEFLAAYKAKHAGEEPSNWDYDWARPDFENMELSPEESVFRPNIDYPPRKLCDAITIEPSGTALIRVYPPGDDSEESMYGTPVARITTYSISFEPKDPADLTLLADVLTKALPVLGDSEPAYKAPGRTRTGNPYLRVAGSAGEDRHWRHTYASSYINTMDGKATPEARFNLDDLQRLYYLMEAVIEPTAQIAAAMNGARYAEERGAILKPDSDGFFTRGGHEIAEPLGTLKSKQDSDLLSSTARDLLTMISINKIDRAGLLVGVMTLAGHTLAGRIHDPDGVYPTYNSILTTMSGEKAGAVMTYDEAMLHRTNVMLRRLFGLADDSDIPLVQGLNILLSRISKPIQEQYHEIERQEIKDFNEQMERELGRYESGNSGLRDQNAHDTDDNPFDAHVKELEQLAIISDAFAGKAYRTEEERKAAQSTGLTRPTGLILADSAVETALDGIDPNSGYRTRSKGSPFPRYELPKSLEAFINPHNAARPTRVLLAILKS